MEAFKRESILSKEKSALLYHGSPNRGIEELEPRRKSHQDPNEGPLIFATQELSLATIFMMDGVSFSGKFGEISYAVIVGSREDFLEKDHGGHVYVVPSENFKSDPNKGLREYEWTTKEKVKPVETIEYKSSLDAVIENGVQVYFIDEATYRQIRNSRDHGLSILENIESENQKRGVNVKLLRGTSVSQHP